MTVAGRRLGWDALIEMQTASDLLAWARDRLQVSEVDAPWLTALVLLEHTTGVGREAVLAHPETVPGASSAAAFRSLVERRCQHEPLAYLVGYREFYGRRFAVTPATLIPRPETEGLIGLALDRVDQLAEARAPRLIDVGIGSGAIAVTLLSQRSQLVALGLDKSLEALKVARVNAVAHGVASRLGLVASDLFTAIGATAPLIVANLPYIPTQELDTLQAEVARYEPRAALDGGADGLQLIAMLLEQGQSVLGEQGSILVEIGTDQAARAADLARANFPDCQVSIENDDAGLARFLVVDRQG